MTLTFEKMIRIQSEQFICRIWCDESGSVSKVKEFAMGHLRALETDAMSIKDAVGNIAEGRPISAVEIISRATGDGLCVYKNWP